MKGIFRKMDALSVAGGAEGARAEKGPEGPVAAAKPAQQFCFNFALPPGDDPMAHADAQKKKKRKKKKKNSKKGAVEGGEESSDDEDVTLQSDTTAPSPQVVPVSEPAITTPPVADEPASMASADAGAAPTAGKSKKKKAKKPAAQQQCVEVPASVPVPAAVPAHVPASNAASLKATPAPQPSASGNGKGKSKKSAKPATVDDWDDDLVLEQAIAQAAQEKKDLKAKKRADMAKGIFPAAKATSCASKKAVDRSAPKILSANDPELDPQMRLHAKFGKGKNLVAIGPPKVRDPRWLSAPPGLPEPAPSAAPEEGLHSSPFSFQFPFQQPPRALPL